VTVRDAIQTKLELTPRQAEVVFWLYEGQGEKQIAQRLGVSIHTVHARVKRVYRKLDVHDRAELLRAVVDAVYHPE